MNRTSQMLCDEKSEQFQKLQTGLVEMYKRIFPDPLAQRTVVVLPSLTLAQSELAKIDGAHHYEERMLCLLMLLRLPRTKLVYLSSQPIPASVIDYFLHLLPGIPSVHARRRLTTLSCFDGSPIPLVQKILDRPRLIKRIKAAIPNVNNAHVSCFNSTKLERELALRLGIPLYAADPALSFLGTKSGSRQIFREAGVPMPCGMENLHDEQEVFAALEELKRKDPDLRKAVIKLNEGFSGEGNAVFSFENCPSEGIRDWIAQTLPVKIEFEAVDEFYDDFMGKFAEMGGIVESFIDGKDKCSPSVQCRINPIGEVEIVSTHDQLLGGPSGQVFLGCTFPANESYRMKLQAIGFSIGEVLRDKGVIGRYGIDFISVKQDQQWEHYAIEINLRKGGTTHPFMMLQYLTNGSFDVESGSFIVPGGEPRYYFASDNLQSDEYKGLCPDDLVDIAVENNLHFHGTIQQGVVFHLIGALSEFGKLGVVCIGDSPASSKTFYEQTKVALAASNTQYRESGFRQ